MSKTRQSHEIKSEGTDEFYDARCQNKQFLETIPKEDRPLVKELHDLFYKYSRKTSKENKDQIRTRLETDNKLWNLYTGTNVSPIDLVRHFRRLANTRLIALATKMWKHDQRLPAIFELTENTGSEPLFVCPDSEIISSIVGLVLYSSRYDENTPFLQIIALSHRENLLNLIAEKTKANNVFKRRILRWCDRDMRAYPVSYQTRFSTLGRMIRNPSLLSAVSSSSAVSTTTMAGPAGGAGSSSAESSQSYLSPFSSNSSGFFLGTINTTSTSSSTKTNAAENTFESSQSYSSHFSSNPSRLFQGTINTTSTLSPTESNSAVGQKQSNPDISSSSNEGIFILPNLQSQVQSAVNTLNVIQMAVAEPLSEAEALSYLFLGIQLDLNLSKISNIAYSIQQYSDMEEILMSTDHLQTVLKSCLTPLFNNLLRSLTMQALFLEKNAQRSTREFKKHLSTWVDSFKPGKDKQPPEQDYPLTKKLRRF